MTGLEKPVQCETLVLDPIKLERLIVQIDSSGVSLRQKRRRRALWISYADLWRHMYRIAAHAARAEQQAARKARKK